MVIESFTFARTPRILFGPGALKRLGEIAAGFGDSVLLVTGKSSFLDSGGFCALSDSVDMDKVRFHPVTVNGEPSPEMVDEVVGKYGGKGIDVVVAIGGGSVLDAGKAVSAMLPLKAPVLDYLEGAGTQAVHDGSKVPFIAVPTTAGTGSEATKNAVLSRVGPDGFKKSLRHENFVPDVALVDPELAVSCPPPVTAACGMDAFTQLLESYVSTKASPMTDALARSGLEHIAGSLVAACTGGAGDVDVRGRMAYGALLSGITLANAGLGVVHGLASPIGGAFDIPHGVVCGTLAAEAAAATIRKLRTLRGPDHPALGKYAWAGAVISGAREKMDAIDPDQGCRMLIEKLRHWIEELNIPRLGQYAIQESDLDGIIAKTGCKNNPVPLEPGEIKEVLRKRL